MRSKLGEHYSYERTFISIILKILFNPFVTDLKPVWYNACGVHVTDKQGRTGSPNFGGIFFRGAPKKKCQNENADQKKKKRPSNKKVMMLRGPRLS
jgi:hypothetical protein